MISSCKNFSNTGQHWKSFQTVINFFDCIKGADSENYTGFFPAARRIWPLFHFKVPSQNVQFLQKSVIDLRYYAKIYSTQKHENFLDRSYNVSDYINKFTDIWVVKLKTFSHFRLLGFYNWLCYLIVFFCLFYFLLLFIIFFYFLLTVVLFVISLFFLVLI